ncbi:MAG TPA: cysteine hydrolase, partial [Gammaproteobacteria bacterium]|nr:cysteine hydrolase [Gammaproteobacteria bacterium]
MVNAMSNTALVLIDMQNDFLHPEGAYARAGINCEAISALPAVLAPVCDAIRRSGDWVLSTHFTLVPGWDAEPFISEHLRELRPFLAKGDFAPGSFGQALIRELSPADLS